MPIANQNSAFKYQKHVYDLDLKDIEARINRAIYKYPKVKEYLTVFKASFLELAANHCKLNGIVYEDEPMIVIPPQNGAFISFFPVSLAFYQAVKVEQVLNHTLKKFNDKNDFVNMLEFVMEAQVDGISFFDRDKRNQRIWNWIDETRKQLSAQTDIKQIIKSAIDLQLIWLGNFATLTLLSKRLYESEYTHRKDDFAKVFREKKIIKWRKEPEYLGYLLYKLYKHNPKQFKASRGKGYLKVAALFYEYSGKLVTQKELHESIHNITKRFSLKHAKLRSRVDLLISQVISQTV